MSYLKRIVNKFPKISEYSSVAAGAIDQSYLNNPGFFGVLQRRALYFAFVPLMVVDLVTSAALSVVNFIGIIFTSDSMQEKFAGNLKHVSTLFSKNFLSLLASPFGFVWPKLVSFYFTPNREDRLGVNAGGDLYSSQEAECMQPESIEAAQEAIKQAAKEGKKVIPMGAGFSQGKQFLPHGKEKTVVLHLKNLNTVEINSKEKTATVGAGAQWSDVQVEANKHKLALQVMQASNVFSVGGSIGTNIHGWDHTQGVLSNTIESMDVLTSEGELVTLTPEDDQFHHVTGGLGLYGTVVRTTIKLTDNELLKQKSVAVEPAQYADYFRANVQNDDRVRMHLYRLSLDPKNLLGEGVSVNYEAEEGTKATVSPDYYPEAPKGTRFQRVALNMARRVPFIRKLYWKSESKALIAQEPVYSRNEIMKPPIMAMINSSVSESEWLQEYFIPGDRLESFRAGLAALLTENNVPLINATIRFVKQHDKSPLSYAHDGDRFALVLCFNQSLQEKSLIKAQKWLRQSQHLAVEHGGTYYLPYQHVSSPEDFEKAYPYAQQAIKQRDIMDPEHLFSSGLAEKYLNPASRLKNHFKELMASEERKNEFKGFLNTVLRRVDSVTLYNLLDDILKYNDTHEEIYKELCRRLPEIMPNFIYDLSHTLDSLSAIKQDLTSQAVELMSDVQTIDGLVEIGYPGRFINGFKKHFQVTGNVVAVYEEQSISDYAQSGFPRPFNQFATLDYAKPNLEGLADNSAEVITCYVGLHHFTEEELPKFLQEIRRVLKEGGRFLLVDHDVKDEKSLCMAHMAHTIFNAVTGASVEEEMSEVRHFRSMEDWKNILQQYDLAYSVDGPDTPMIRENDPSRNRMVCFKATPECQLNHPVDAANESLSSESAGDWRKDRPLNSCSPRRLSTFFAPSDSQESTERLNKQEAEERISNSP